MPLPPLPTLLRLPQSRIFLLFVVFQELIAPPLGIRPPRPRELLVAFPVFGEVVQVPAVGYYYDVLILIIIGGGGRGGAEIAEK